MSAIATGDHPAGSRPASPCCVSGVNDRLAAVGNAPGGTLSCAGGPGPTGQVMAPPSTAETLVAGADNSVSLASRSSSAWFTTIGVGRSTRVQPGLVIRTTPCPSVARNTQRPRESLTVDAAYASPVVSVPISRTMAPASGSPAPSS